MLVIRKINVLNPFSLPARWEVDASQVIYNLYVFLFFPELSRKVHPCEKYVNHILINFSNLKNVKIIESIMLHNVVKIEWTLFVRSCKWRRHNKVRCTTDWEILKSEDCVLRKSVWAVRNQVKVTQLIIWIILFFSGSLCKLKQNQTTPDRAHNQWRKSWFL